MSLEFNERFFTEEMRGDTNHPHFLKRAKWIANYIEPNSIVYILGCGFGYTVKYLRDLGVNAIGIEVSEYAYNRKKDDYIFNWDIIDCDFSNAHYLFSWNVLDCLNETKAVEIANHLNKFSAQQIHIVCCLEDKPAKKYIDQNYFIKPIKYWQDLMPNAILVEYGTEKVYGIDSLKIPLSCNKVSL